MAYQTIEQLLSRRGEKVAMLLTIENMIGGGLCAALVYFGTNGVGLIARGFLMLLAFALGVALTVETDGMAIYERVYWRIRGQVRLRIQGSALNGDSLPGIQIRTDHRAIRIGGIVRKARPADQRAATRAVTRLTPAPVFAADVAPPEDSMEHLDGDLSAE